MPRYNETHDRVKVLGCEERAASHELRATSCEPRAASHELRATKKGATEATPFFTELLSYCSTDLLLQLHHCAGALEGLLRFLGGLLIYAFQDGTRGPVDEGLGFLETEARETTYFLDHLDLLVANGDENDVEFVLLFFSGGFAACYGHGCHGHGGRCSHVELLLKGFEELRQFEDTHLLE